MFENFESGMLNPYEIYKNETTKIVVEKDVPPSTTATKEAYDFALLAPNASESIKSAWESAAKKTGVNHNDNEGNLTHINAMFTLQLQDKLLGRGNDFLGADIESAISATKRALHLMLNSPNEVCCDSIDRSKEIAFYNAFLDCLHEK